jgi:hypothetical protein
MREFVCKLEPANCIVANMAWFDWNAEGFSNESKYRVNTSGPGDKPFVPQNLKKKRLSLAIC